MKSLNYKILFTQLLLVFSSYSFGSIVILNGLTHENTALPSETYRNEIEIQNTSAFEKSVRVYAKDYWYSHKGNSKHDAPGTLTRSNAHWISFQPELVTLSPNEKTIIQIEVRVPNTDSIQGTYWSVLMVEGIVPPDTSKTAGVSIRTALRYAVQLITNIGDTGLEDLNFLGMQLTKQDSLNAINVMVENIGERILKPILSIELFDAEGRSAGIIKADQRRTLPTTSIKILINLEGIKPGSYTGVLVADCGGESIFGTNVSFEII